MKVAGMLLAGVSFTTLAASPISRLEVRFNLADTDHNGKLIKAEAQSGVPRVAKMFASINTTHSGTITYSQLAKFIKSHCKSRQ